MATITQKVLDNTVISAGIKEIKAINLIQECAKHYPLSTAKEVYEETKSGFKKEIVEECYKLIQIKDLSNNQDYNSKMSFLQKRFPQLHKGELSSFLVAWLCYSKNKTKCIYITDDNGMKKAIKKIKEDNNIFGEWKKLFGLHESELDYTGTIGVICHLKQKGLLTQEQIEGIVKDLTSPNSTFRIGQEQIKLLRGA
ncbi:MAG: hypothetical protein PHC46_04430 [Clostridia bacterium]|nr:hypothetical protein [Clostridia bacterium]